MYLEVVGKIESIETIAAGGRIREIMRLRKQFGPGRWRKMKGFADVRLLNGNIRSGGTSVRGARRRAAEDENQAVCGVVAMARVRS